MRVKVSDRYYRISVLGKEFMRGEIINLNDTKLGFDYHSKKLNRAILKAMIEEGVVKEIDQYHDNYDEGEGTDMKYLCETCVTPNGYKGDRDTMHENFEPCIRCKHNPNNIHKAYTTEDKHAMNILFGKTSYNGYIFEGIDPDFKCKNCGLSDY